MTDWNNVKVASPYDDTPDATQATKEELEHVINTQNIPHTVPEMQRFNPKTPYADLNLRLDPRDKILLSAVEKAIANGWDGWKTRVNDATTVGLEAQQVIKEMKRRKDSVKDLLFDQDFAKAFWGEDYVEHLKDMVVAPDVILFIKGSL